MNTKNSIGTSSRRFLSVFLSLILLLPGAALADGKNGKKNFKEGLKYEQLQQWDMAAQKFALALSAEPNNPEYKVHYLQALQRASLMYITRGDALADQNDFSGAYMAYRQAYNFDPGNEIAKFKMERMIELQKAQATGTSDQFRYNTKTGAVTPVKNEILVADRPRSKSDFPTDVNFTNVPFKQAVKSLAEPLNLNIVFDDTVQDNLRVTINLNNVTPARALDMILMQKKFAFEQVDRRTIFIYPDSNPGNRSRFERLLIKTFYLNNISAMQAKNVLSQMLPPGRQAATVDTVGATGGGGNSNILVVKATPAELQLVQDLLANIDKNKNEVVLDVEIYEVANDSLVQIGNQFVTSPVEIPITTRNADGEVTGSTTIRSASLSNLGGIGLTRLNNVVGDTSIGGNLFSPFLGGLGTLFGLPPTQLSLLQSRGKSKLLHKTQIHVLDGGENEVKVGRRVPVRVGTQYLGGGINFGLNGLNNNQGGIAQNIANGLVAGLGGFNGFSNGFDQIQYQDVGLVIKAKPTITNEGYVEIKMNFESSDVVSSGADALALTPTFTQRSLNTVARIQDGVTAVVAGVNQDVKGDSRSGVPVLGMLPLVGRLFATPRQESRQTDVIITVTPHIVRSAGITKDDYLARYGPPQTGGMNQRIEDVLNRAQVEEEEEQRLIAQQQGPGAPNAGGAAQTSQPASFDPQRRPSVSQPAGFNGQQQPSGVPQPAVQPVNNPGNRRSISVFSPVGAPPAPPERREADVPPDQDGVPNPDQSGQEANGNGESSEAGQQGSPDAAIASLRQQSVDRAVSRMFEDRARSGEFANDPNSGVSFSLSPKSAKEKLGKSFTVTVDVSGEQQMSGADIALKYDPTKLQVKSVRDAGLFGSRPTFKYDSNKKGVLNISVEHPNSAPTATAGRLVTVEFFAIGEGQAEIALSGGQTRARVGNAQIPVAGSATQVTIGRD